ncbi:MAG: single-stranded-DNA-specific exonuclease RecJ [Chloroflexota bacterium]|nr:single-stranded-DNA-specific exonuclease RecJ [Chloroflexota bacterium]
MARTRWIDPEPLPPALTALHRDPLLAELLYRRGLRDPDAAQVFLDARPRPAPDPALLPNMDRAVERVCRALERGERIAVFGDYDADGVTSTALLTRALRAAAGPDRVVSRVPTRVEGYGLSRNAIDAFHAAGANLLIAVDCASTDHEHVAYARECGLDVLVLDHHQMRDGGPTGAIVVSPQLPSDSESTPRSYRELSAVGIAYLLVAALAREGCRVDGSDGREPETDLLDLVALGTIGDVAPLTGPNRSLVRDGLRRLRERPRPGIAALCRRAGIDPGDLASASVTFKLVPRLNAAGRMADPALALDLLLTDDHPEAERLAAEIEALNARRKAESRQVVEDAEALLRTQPGWTERRVLVVSSRSWGGGVLGIAAGQLAERYGRPAIVLSDDGTVSRGSARSVSGFDIAGALACHSHLLDHHGGHSQAAGLTMPTAHVPGLTDALEAAIDAEGVALAAEPEIRIDADVPLERLTLATARLLADLEPHGAGNEPPVFRVRGARVAKYNAIGADRRHLKLHVGVGRGAIPVVAWGAADRSSELLRDPVVDLLVALSVDRWDGQTRLQVEAKDFRPAE